MGSGLLDLGLGLGLNGFRAFGFRAGEIRQDLSSLASLDKVTSSVFNDAVEEFPGLVLSVFDKYSQTAHLKLP